MPKFIVRIPDSYAPRFSSNLVEMDADSVSDAKSKTYSLLNIPAVLLSVSPKPAESNAVQNAATKLQDLKTFKGENVVENKTEFGRFGPVPIVKTKQVPASEFGRAAQALREFELNQQRNNSFALGEGEAASLTPTPSTLVNPSGRSSSMLVNNEEPSTPFNPVVFGADNNEDLLRLDELESQMFDSLARGRSVPEDVIEELEELRGGEDYEESSLAAGIFDDNVLEEAKAEVENPEMPGNLPAYWQKNYDEYLALSPELQKIILDRQIQNDIELDPYRSLGGTELNFLLGDPNATVNPDGSISFGPKFEPQVPDPSQLEGFAATDLQDILNIFYANPEQYISEVPLFEDIYDPDTGQVIGQRQVGTQQVLSPVAQAALQAFSTQRGAESADVASRFGTATPFGVIAGMGGETAAADALTLAKLQAKAGVNNPFAALQTDAKINDISTILRGGLTPEQQLALAQAPGNPFGLSAQQQIDLQNQLARGGISPEQRLAEQRMALLPQLFQTSPQALGGLQRVLGEQQLQQALTPFFSAGTFQPQAQVADSVSFAQGPSGTNVNINPDLVENVSGRSPFAGDPVTQTISGTTQPVSAVSPGFRPTVGQFQRADLFERGGLEAEAGMAGQELTPFLQDVTPLGASTRPGGLGAQRTTRFTY